MPRIVQQPIPKPAVAAFAQSGIKLTKFKSPASFERELKKFLRKNHVLHLSTCRGNSPRSTALEFRLNGLTFFILSEGGGKFANLAKNRKVAFSMAEPYNSEEDFWGYAGLQAWGTAVIHRQSKDPERFNQALKKMKIGKILKNMGMKSLPPGIDYRIIEIAPDRIRYGNPRAGVYWVTWHRAG
jgi:hypothetical protein